MPPNLARNDCDLQRVCQPQPHIEQASSTKSFGEPGTLRTKVVLKPAGISNAGNSEDLRSNMTESASTLSFGSQPMVSHRCLHAGPVFPLAHRLSIFASLSNCFSLCRTAVSAQQKVCWLWALSPEACACMTARARKHRKSYQP